MRTSLASIPCLALVAAAPALAQEVVEVGAEDQLASSINLDAVTNAGAAYHPPTDSYLLLGIGAITIGDDRNVCVLRLDAGTGAALAGPTYISAAPDAGSGLKTASIAYAPDHDEFLVVWHRYNGLKSKIHGQRLDGLGNEIGADDFTIGTKASLGDVHVVYNPDAQEYLAVWAGRDSLTQSRVRAQRVTWDGVEVGADDFPISSPDLQNLVGMPSVAYNPDAGEYLVTFDAQVGTVAGSYPNIEHRVLAQRLSAQGAEIGVDDQPISEIFLTGYLRSATVYAPELGRYLVAFGGDHAPPSAQLLAGATGAELGDDLPLLPGVIPALSASDWIAGAWLPSRGVFQVAWSPSFGGASARLVDGALGSLLGPETVVAPGIPQTVANRSPTVTPRGDGPEALVAFTRSYVDFWGTEMASNVAFQRTDVSSCGAFAASSVVRLGAPPNPSALVDASAGPELGHAWTPSIDHASFVPASVLDALAISGLPINAPTAFGTLLVDPAAAVVWTVAPGAPFEVLVPASCTFAGASLSAQGLSVDASGSLALTNALDVVLGAL